MEEAKQISCNNTVKAFAILLCVLFFVLPLVQGRSGYTASGWEVAVGTGNLFSATSDSSYPFFFLFLIVPIILLVQAFARKSFAVMGIVSLIGLFFQFAFIITVQAGGRNWGFRLTGISWIVLAVYIGLCAFIFHWAKLDKSINNQSLKKCPFCANEIKIDAVVCQFCGKDLPNNK
ncbi:MAG: zinc ribbon domain-containing protein [Spirochaetaceae bacterium]|jgi:hypothetical protein|nr:zinc ribbon domain-containing protein [Spirochaetaceae bacterium]